MKNRATRILLATSAVLSAAAVALAGPAPADEPTPRDAGLAPTPARVQQAAALMNEPVCLRCHWCPFGDEGRGGRGGNGGTTFAAPVIDLAALTDR